MENSLVLADDSVSLLGRLIQEYLVQAAQSQVLFCRCAALPELAARKPAVSHFFILFNGEETGMAAIVKAIRLINKTALVVIVCPVPVTESEVKLLFREGANAMLSRYAV